MAQAAAIKISIATTHLCQRVETLFIGALKKKKEKEKDNQYKL